MTAASLPTIRPHASLITRRNDQEMKRRWPPSTATCEGCRANVQRSSPTPGRNTLRYRVARRLVVHSSSSYVVYGHRSTMNHQTTANSPARRCGCDSKSSHQLFTEDVHSFINLASYEVSTEDGRPSSSTKQQARRSHRPANQRSRQRRPPDLPVHTTSSDEARATASSRCSITPRSRTTRLADETARISSPRSQVLLGPASHLLSTTSWTPALLRSDTSKDPRFDSDPVASSTTPTFDSAEPRDLSPLNLSYRGATDISSSAATSTPILSGHQKALAPAMARSVKPGRVPGLSSWKLDAPSPQPSIDVIIPTRDRIICAQLHRALETRRPTRTGRHLADNDSIEPESLEYFATPQYRVCRVPDLQLRQDRQSRVEHSKPISS